MIAKYPRNKVIAIDVDGTLFKHGRVNTELVHHIGGWAAEGYEIIIWSARGTAHAQKAAHMLGVEHLCAAIISKPGYIVDDKGWAWTKYTKRLTAHNAGKEPCLE